MGPFTRQGGKGPDCQPIKNSPSGEPSLHVGATRGFPPGWGVRDERGSQFGLGCLTPAALGLQKMATAWRGPLHWDSGGKVWWAGSLGLASSLKLTPGARPSSLLLSSGGKLPGTGDRWLVWTILVCVDTTQAHKASCLSQPPSRRGETANMGPIHIMTWHGNTQGKPGFHSGQRVLGLASMPVPCHLLLASRKLSSHQKSHATHPENRILAKKR